MEARATLRGPKVSRTLVAGVLVVVALGGGAVRAAFRRLLNGQGTLGVRLTDSARARFGALRALRELASCSDSEILSLLRYADEVRLAAGAKVAHEGAPATEFVVIIEGTLRATFDGALQLLGPGDSSGWDAMWERLPNRATVTAESDVRLLVMSHEQFRAVKALVNYGPWQHNEPGLGAVAVTRHVSRVSP